MWYFSYYTKHIFYWVVFVKKFIERTFVILLISFSFFYTDKVINIINHKNPLMKEIEELKSKYDVLPVNAILDNDTIVPGIKGREINIDDSYNNMKLGGIFREEALVFKDIYPTSSINNNMDKYIVKGNGSKKEISIIVILNNNIDKIKKLDNITVFINHKDITNSNIKLLKDKEIYTYGKNGEYNKEILINDNTLINRLSNNKSNYCLLKDKDDGILKLCSENNMYTVIPNIYGDYYNIRNNLSNGSIILLSNINNIDVIVKYIESKGYEIVGLNKLLSE